MSASRAAARRVSDTDQGGGHPGHMTRPEVDPLTPHGSVRLLPELEKIEAPCSGGEVLSSGSQYFPRGPPPLCTLATPPSSANCPHLCSSAISSASQPASPGLFPPSCQTFQRVSCRVTRAGPRPGPAGLDRQLPGKPTCFVFDPAPPASVLPGLCCPCADKLLPLNPT